MNLLVGTYECKVDAKGRLPLPAGLKKQWAGILDEGFVLKRSVFQPCLELYPIKEWGVIMEDINKLNRFIKKNNDFIRVFLAGAKPVDADGNSRIQIAKEQVAFAGIEKDVVLSPSGNIIEVWDKERYEKSVDINEEEFVSLTEEVMGGIKKGDDVS